MKPSFHVTQANVNLSTDRPVRATRVPVPTKVWPHNHDYHEISLIAEGSADHVTAKGTQRVQRGDVVVIGPGDVHAFERPKNMVAINVYYLAEWLSTDPALLWSEPGLVPLFCSGSLVRLPGFGAKVFRLEEESVTAVERELDEMQRELARDAPGPALLKGCFLKLITSLARAWREQDSASLAATRFRAEVWQTIRRIERCVSGGQAFVLSKLADQVGLSPDHLSAEFRAAVGYSPVQYFQQRRVQRACQLLGDRRLSMTEIAQSLGYADAAHFCRHFKTHQEMTPRAYRATYAQR